MTDDGRTTPAEREPGRPGRRRFLRDAVGYMAQTAGSLSGLVRNLDVIPAATRAALEPAAPGRDPDPDALDQGAIRIDSLEPRYRIAELRLDLVDRRRLPAEVRWLELPDGAAVAAAVEAGVVGGLPTLPAVGAYAMALAARAALGRPAWAWRGQVEGTASALVNAAPDAEGLRWALVRMLAPAQSTSNSDREARAAWMAVEACRIEREARRDVDAIARRAVASWATSREDVVIAVAGDPGAALANALASITRRRRVSVRLLEEGGAPWEAAIGRARLAEAGIDATVTTIERLVVDAPRRSLAAFVLRPRAVEVDGGLVCAPGCRSVASLASAYGVPVVAFVPTWLVRRGGDVLSGVVAPRLFVGQLSRAESLERSLVTSILTEAGDVRGSDPDGLRSIAAARLSARARRWRTPADA